MDIIKSFRFINLSGLFLSTSVIIPKFLKAHKLGSFYMVQTNIISTFICIQKSTFRRPKFQLYTAVYICIWQYTAVNCIMYVWIIYKEYVKNPNFNVMRKLRKFELCSLSQAREIMLYTLRCLSFTQNPCSPLEYFPINRQHVRTPLEECGHHWNLCNHS